MTPTVLGIVSLNACIANRHSCCGTHELIERPRLERRLAVYEEGESENTKRSQTASERQEPSCETDWARQVTTGIHSKELIQCRHMRLDRGIVGSPTLLRQPLLVNPPRFVRACGSLVTSGPSEDSSGVGAVVAVGAGVARNLIVKRKVSSMGCASPARTDR